MSTCAWESTRAAFIAASWVYANGSSTSGPTMSLWPTTWNRAAFPGMDIGFSFISSKSEKALGDEHRRRVSIFPEGAREVRLVGLG